MAASSNELMDWQEEQLTDWGKLKATVRIQMCRKDLELGLEI